MAAYKGFVNPFAKILMGTSKTAVQNSGQSSFRISGIGTGMAGAITEYKTEEQYEQFGNERKVSVSCVD